MSETQKNDQIGLTENTADRAAAPQDAAALLTRLSTLAADVPPLDETQAKALYRRALQKAGPANAAEAAADTDGAPESFAENGQPPVRITPEKKKPIRWQRWGVSAAAALAVVALGGMALVRGGFGFATDSAKMECAPKAAMDMAAQEPAEAVPETEEAALYDAAAEAVPKDILTADADTGTGTYTEYSRTGDAAESSAEETAAVESAAAEEHPAVESGVYNDTADSSMTEAEPPTDALPGGTAQVQLLMANGRLYRATALAVGPVAEDDDRTACIETVIAADEIPTENGQANFDAKGAPYVLQRDGAAVLLDGVWVFFEPVE